MKARHVVLAGLAAAFIATAGLAGLTTNDTPPSVTAPDPREVMPLPTEPPMPEPSE